MGRALYPDTLLTPGLAPTDPGILVRSIDSGKIRRSRPQRALDKAAGKARTTTRPPLSQARMPGGRGGGVAFLVDVELMDHARGDSRHIVADREGNPLVAGREEQLDVVAEVAGEDPLEVGFGDAPADEPAIRGLAENDSCSSGVVPPQ